MSELNKGKLFSTIIELQKGANYFNARNGAKYLLQGSRAVADNNIVEIVNNSIVEFASKNKSLSILDNFTCEFTKWTQINQLKRFDCDFSAGTTQSFDSFYFRHREKRFRCFVGEYFYHLKTWESNKVNWSFVDDKNPLKPGDALVLSVPFCDTGNFEHRDILEYCEKYDVPVLLDMCYYPLTDGFDINLDYSCIDTITFSLSKVYPVAHYRIGVRYTKNNVFDGQKLHHTINYNNILSAFIGLKLINLYSINEVYTKLRKKQVDACTFFNIKPSSSVIFGIGNKDWDLYSRKNLLTQFDLNFDSSLFINRICLTPIFENWELFENFKNAYPILFQEY